MMRFQSNHQQSPGQHVMLKQLAAKRGRTKEESFVLITQLATQGVPEFKVLYERLYKQYEQPSARRYLDELRDQWSAIQEIDAVQDAFREPDLMRQLYALDEPFFEAGEQHPEIVLVIFTTMYNSFYFSNLVMRALLRKLGISLLFLKDSTRLNYLEGVPGFTDHFCSSVSAIREFLQGKGVTDIYITGFSSGGFASLLMSSMIECRGYLGFSILTDLSETSSLPSGKFMAGDIKANLDAAVRLDMRQVIVEQSDNVPRRLIYGAKSSADKAHALHLASAPGVEVVEVADCAHLTPATLLVNRQLLREFESLVF